MRRSVFAPALIAAVGAAASVAADNIRILPDQAALACASRAQFVLQTRDGRGMLIDRLIVTPQGSFAFRVKGSVTAEVEGETKTFDVQCRVSSSEGAVVVFTMTAAPPVS